LTPANFELAMLLLDEDSRELRERYQALPRPIRQADFSSLARDFLPQRVLLDDLEPLSSLLSGALEALGVMLAREQKSINAYVNEVKEVQGALAGHPDIGDVHHLLSSVSAASLLRSQSADRLMRSISVCTEGLQAFGQALTVKDSEPDEAVAVQAVAVDRPETTLPDPVETFSPDGSGLLRHGLKDRAGLMARLEELRSGEKRLSGYSLLLCRLNGLEHFRTDAMLKAREFVLDTLGQQTVRLMSAGEGAYWNSPQELGLLLQTTNELELQDLSAKLKRIVQHSLSYARRSTHALPDVHCRFGGASAYGATSPSQLLGKAGLALQRADLTDEERPVLTAVAGVGPTDRRYDRLYGRALH
jgi:hypothetical protein